MPSNSVTILCGPTAVGKTAFAVEKALKENAEIISADSGQVYRGLTIGTAKPILEERRGIRFHLIDVLNPNEKFSAADFREQALEKIREIQERGKKVFVVGGTGLYLKVLEEGIFEGPKANPEIRKRLEERIEKGGIQPLFEELKKIDPTCAAKMHGYNRQRIIRALEVYELTGRPISSFWITPPRPPSYIKRGEFKIGLTLPRDELRQSIHRRVGQMIEKGWVEETKKLLEKWGPDIPALKIIGYKELVSHLQGKLSLQEAIEEIKISTCQYAKRQMTWFKRDQEIRWQNP